MPAVVSKKETAAVTDVSISVSIANASGHLKKTILTEFSWLEHGIKLIAQIEVDKGDSIAWAAYHASRCDVDTSCPTVTQLMPLLYEKSASVAMVRHGMTVQLKH